MNAQLSQTRIVLVWPQMHILESQLLELMEEPVGQASRLNEPGPPALLLGALGFTDFVVGGRQWSHGGSSPSAKSCCGTKISSDRHAVNFWNRDRNRPRKRSACGGRKRPPCGGAREVGFGEAEGPRRSNLKAGIRRRAEELGGIVGSVLSIGSGDEGGERRWVEDQLGFALDHDGLVGVVGGDGTVGLKGKVARFARRTARTEPERVIDPHAPDRHHVGAGRRLPRSPASSRAIVRDARVP